MVSWFPTLLIQISMVFRAVVLIDGLQHCMSAHDSDSEGHTGDHEEHDASPIGFAQDRANAVAQACLNSYLKFDTPT